MNKNLNRKEYKTWLTELKQKVRQTQLKAAVKINSALLEFYWELGTDIVERQKNTSWGSGFLKQLSKDLMAEFPDIKGFSKRNLEHIRRWHKFYSNGFVKGQQSVAQLDIFAKQPATQLKTSLKNHHNSYDEKTKQLASLLFQIPWWHNLKQALYYVQKTIEHGWSRSVLTHQLESGLYEREGKAITNFSQTMPEPQSDLAQQIIKDPYNFDFLTLTKDYNERVLEKGLLEHITDFLLELGTGFSFVGKQKALKVGEKDFYIDLLFYHTKMHCYVVVELKTVDFEPEFAGKLNFYIKAVDEQVKTDRDEPTIGILLCKGRDKIVVEYALSDIHKPMGVSEYELTKSLPEEFRSSLPSIEEIEAELMRE